MPLTPSRLRLADGFALVTVMGAMLVGGLLVAAGFAAATGDIPIARQDEDRKLAYAAAEAGVNNYFFHITRDNNYWTRCTNVPPPNQSEPTGVNQAWSGSGTDPRSWRSLPGSSAQWAVELLPANGYAQCSESESTQSMIDADSGTFRIRATGRSRGVKRSVIATFRRRSFLDYLYFTDFETSDPVTYATPSMISWASANCQRWYRQARSSSCTAIHFAAADVISGPFHTNDDILTCGSPTFGRTRTDPVEVSAPDPGRRNLCAPATPNFLGTWGTSAPVLTVPPSNSSLSTLAGATYTGRTRIALSGSSMTVTPPSGSASTVPIPANGLVYVRSGSCGSSGYSIYQDYTTPPGCGTAYVRGASNRSVTIAADNDVIVDGSLTRSGDAMIGLIANNFVRIYHPVTRDSQNPNLCTNAAGTMQDVQVDAAVLALQHSFIVDNYYCGQRLGTLTVNGAIAQRFRGPVGVAGSTNAGYTKNYVYDDRLRYREPPHFLDPVAASWRVVRVTEQVPPR